MNFKEQLMKVLNKLGLTQKASEKKLTNEDWAKIAESFKAEFGVEIGAAAAQANAPAAPELDPDVKAQAEAILYGKSKKTEKEEDDDKEDDENASSDNEEDDKEEDTGSKKKKKATSDPNVLIAGLTNVINRLSKSPEDGSPKDTGKISPNAVNAMVLGLSAHTEKYLFGIEHPFFAKGKFHTDIMLNKKFVDVDAITPDQKQAFMQDFTDYVSGLKKRTAELDKRNLLSGLNFDKMVSGESTVDYSDLMDKAGEYIVRRQDLILAYLRSLPSVTHIFSKISNIQNKEVAPGANFGELSQGYRAGKIFKGNVAFTAEIYSVVDVMFKFQFIDMIKLEKQYIGYLNRVGSDVIKWSFIEWIIVHFSKILMNEQNRRNVVGVRVPQQDVVANPAMLAADGALRAIERVEEQNKVLPFEDLKTYTDQTILGYLETMYGYVEQIVPSMDGYKMYVNEKHRRWYLAQYREKYGKDGDFNSNSDQLIDTLTPQNIVWYPNADATCYKVWITLPGNVELYEDKPFEMQQFYFERDFESILTLSRWKEGAGLQMAGVQYPDKATLLASGRKDQWIFTNYPATVVAKDATTVDGSKNTLFLTSDNTDPGVNPALTLTNITNASIEKVYKIVCGNTTHATTIKKDGNFSKITADWVPTAVGDYIKLYAELENYTTTVDGETVTKTRATGKFLELERKVTA